MWAFLVLVGIIWLFLLLVGFFWAFLVPVGWLTVGIDWFTRSGESVLLPFSVSARIFSAEGLKVGVGFKRSIVSCLRSLLYFADSVA